MSNLRSPDISLRLEALPWQRREFWQGCLNVLDPTTDHDAMSRIETIMAGLEAGTRLEELPEFWRWLGRAEFGIPKPLTELSICR
jgi:hypothetical protein